MTEWFDQQGALGYALVFLAAATPLLEILLVIPAGVAAGLAPAPVTAAALAGNALTVVAVVLFADRLRGWWGARRRSRRDPVAGEPGDAAPAAARHEGGGRAGRARRLVERYGVPGLAFVAPLLTGTHVAAVAALAIGARRGPVLLWMLAGLAAWAVAVGVAAALGLELLGR